MTAAAIKAGQAFVEISARDKKLQDTLAANKERLSGFVRGVATITAAAAAAAAAEAIRTASRLEEVLNKFNVVFGDNREAMKAWGDEFAAQVGRSQRQIAEFLAGTQDLLIPVGFDSGAAEAMSKEITQLAVDVASFNNRLDADVLRDFHSALTGGGETVKKYGVVLDVAATKAKLLEAGIDPSTASNAQKVWARWQIILESTTAAQGDAIRSSDSYANQMKRLEGQMEDLAGALGESLLPMATAFVQSLNDIITPTVEWLRNNQELVSNLASAAAIVASVVALLASYRAILLLVNTAQKLVMASSGPVGWALLAASIVVAKLALSDVNDTMARTAGVAERVADKIEGVADATRKVQAAQSDLATNTDRVSELIDKQRTGAERLAEQLDTVAERERILDRLRRGGRNDDDRFFNPDQLEELRSRLIDAATGFRSEMQRARDEIAKLNGELTDSEIKLRKMARDGLPKDELAEMRAIFAELDAARDADKQRKQAARDKEAAANEQKAQREAEFQELQAGADQIKAAIMTPAERLAEQIMDMRQMIDAGVLDRDTANQFLRQQFQERANQQAQAAANFRRQNSTDLRSSQSTSLLADLLSGTKTSDNKKLQAAIATAKNTQEIKEAIEENGGFAV